MKETPIQTVRRLERLLNAAKARRFQNLPWRHFAGDVWDSRRLVKRRRFDCMGVNKYASKERAQRAAHLWLVNERKAILRDIKRSQVELAKIDRRIFDLMAVTAKKERKL